MRKGSGFKVWGFLSLLLAALFWIWSSPDFRASKKIPINFWTGFTGPDGEQMVGLIREFHRLNPDVEVSLQRIDWGVYYNKLFVAGLGKRGPEVFVLHAGMMPRFASAGLMAEMDGMLDAESRAALEDLVPVVRPKLQWEGQLVAWPLDVHMLGLYCNLDLFREAGWVDDAGNPRVPRTREEFLEAAASIRRLSRPGREIWGFGIADPNLTALTSCYQHGGRLFSPDLLTPSLLSPQNIAGLDFLRELVARYRVAPPPESNDSWIGFRQGNIGMVRGHLAQKDLDNALGRLREAFLAGEHLAAVRSFPWEQKQVLWKYKKTLEEARAGLASKDLGKARLAMEKLGQMTGDHPLSREFSEMANVQSISSLHLSRAKEAAARGDRETMNKELEEAAKAWPQNPDLADGSKKMIEQMSQQAQGKGELRKLIEQNNDSFIEQDKARFLAVAADDPKLLAQLQTILEKQMKSKTWQVKAEELLRRGDAAGAWEQAEAGLQEHPGQTDLIQIRSDAAMRCPEYITAIERARQSERKDDPVAALGGYLAARSLYPGSELAKKEIQKLSDRLLQN